MGQIITLPKNYSAASNDVGSLTLVSGDDYKRENVKLSEARTAIGESTYNLSLLNNSTNINKWAAFKPTNGGNGGDHGLLALTLGGQLTYPTRVAPFSLGQWGGYNHQALPPQLNSSGTQQINYTPGSIQNIAFIYNLGEIDWRDVIYSSYGMDTINVIDHDGITLIGTHQITDALLAAGTLLGNFDVDTTGFSGTVNRTYSIWFGQYYSSPTQRDKVFYVPDGNGYQINVQFNQLIIIKSFVASQTGWVNVNYTDFQNVYVDTLNESVTPTSAGFQFRIGYLATSGSGYVGETGSETVDIWYRIKPSGGSYGAYQLWINNTSANGATYTTINSTPWNSGYAPSYGDTVEFKFMPNGVTP